MPAPKPNSARVPTLVQVLELLPQRVRERFCYVALALVAAVVIYGLWRAPAATAAGSGGVSVMMLIGRLLNR